MPLRLEAGTPNTPAFAGLNAAVNYCRENQGAIVEKEKHLTGRLVAGLLSISSKKNIRVCDPDCGERLPVVSFTIKGMDPEEAGFTLAEGFGISCRTGLHCAPLIHQFLGSLPGGTIRLSPSAATEDGEIDYALEAIASVAS
jgi:selenocysteine lyase/cysteine desulfurase